MQLLEKRTGGYHAIFDGLGSTLDKDWCKKNEKKNVLLSIAKVPNVPNKVVKVKKEIFFF